MLAAHRDQENLVHSHQVPTKQQPKTPGARYPKTPMRFGQNDENAPTAFAGKTGLGGTKHAGNDKIMMTKGKQPMMTPMAPQTQSRAPLGNKTTNAKARSGQPGGVKSIVKDIEKSQAKTIQKPKAKVLSHGPLQADGEIKLQGESDDNEPEYAPPKPEDLPFESDILPAGGLTFEGLKKENLFRGYYQQFYNPVDDNGVSRKEKRFNQEMNAVMDNAVEKNDRDLAALDWNSLDAPDSPKLLQKKPDAPDVAEAKMAKKIRGTSRPRQPPTITARKAASALSLQPQHKRIQTSRPASVNTAEPARRPLSTLIAGTRSAKQSALSKKNVSHAHNAGEAASRTTIGYNKGKSASSLVHARDASALSSRGRTGRKTPVLRDDDSELTITPLRARDACFGPRSAQAPRPQFLSIFNQEEDDEELPPVSVPFPLDDEEEQEFELKLDI